MVKVSKSADLADQVIQRAVEHYRAEAKRIPKPFRTVNEAVIVEALAIAGGVWTRLEVISDKEIMVHNDRVWT